MQQSAIKDALRSKDLFADAADCGDIDSDVDAAHADDNDYFHYIVMMLMLL